MRNRSNKYLQHLKLIQISKTAQMLQVVSFMFNPFQENTYLLFDETAECVIFDPGCHTAAEQKILKDYIAQNNLTPVRLINTHCHIDHIFGNTFVANKYGLGLEIHKNELPLLEAAVYQGKMWGINVEPSPQPSRFLTEKDTIQFGNTTLEILFTPGHSPASLSFYCREAKIVIAGDVLFRESIGRTDLPGGNYQTLIYSIRTKLLTLDDDVIVYSGHGPSTTIGYERTHNPFLQ